MNNKKRILYLRLWPLVVFMIAGLASCSTITLNYKGTTVPESNLILLEKGTHQGDYQTPDINVHYTYSENGDRLKISGIIKFDDRLKYNFDNINYFDFWIYFVNSENKITGDKSINTLTAFNQIEPINFDKDIQLPADTKAIVFSYYGRVSAVGNSGSDDRRFGGGGMSWRLWKTPVD